MFGLTFLILNDFASWELSLGLLCFYGILCLIYVYILKKYYPEHLVNKEEQDYDQDLLVLT